MRRADRLFAIVQALRRRKVTTAQQLAGQLEVSERTIYRDIADLGAQGIPIVGEAGVGYMLARGVDLPPLMFSLDEVQALVLGVRMVERFADKDLRVAARSALDKIEDALPAAERERMTRSALFAMSFAPDDGALETLRELRSAVRARQAVSFAYRDREGQPSRRSVRPLTLAFWGRSWTLGAWCELREDYRNFRIDRVQRLRVLKRTFPDAPPFTLEAYVEAMTARA
jgi:predicted DNA-binding transcriptional regulator YafY